MKTTVVPAQITSVEDRIAGNFTFTQVLLLIAALLVGTGIYVGVTPRTDLTVLKTVLVTIQFLFFGGLAIRINGKIVAQWLVTYLRFHSRPRYYAFTKNDATHREIILPEIEQEKLTIQTSQKIATARPTLSFDEQMRVDQLLDNPSLTLSFELAKKGGIDVSLVPVKE